jgi:2-oxoglutarate dehydrogenase E2 component (dihydrolipoamide succinyltransferase)
MEVMPKKAVVAAAVVLALVAALGAYQGWRRSGADEAQVAADGSLLPTTAAVSGVRQASALVETAPTLSEAQVREIARQEVRASLRGDSSSSSESAPSTPAAPAAGASAPIGGPAPPRVAPAAPVVPAAPAPAAEPAPAANAPLF